MKNLISEVAKLLWELTALLGAVLIAFGFGTHFKEILEGGKTLDPSSTVLTLVAFGAAFVAITSRKLF